MSGSLRLGIDVGGTHTDAVVVAPDGEVLAWHKTPTTTDVLEGIALALGAVLRAVDSRSVGRVMLGTTHPLNAIIRRSGLAKVGILRIAAPATLSVSPLAGWPQDLVKQVRGRSEVIFGGHRFDGTEITPLDRAAVRAFARACAGQTDAISVTGAMSPANPDHEHRARQIIHETLGEQFPVTLGHEVGGLGILERENSAALNAALIPIGRTILAGLRKALAQHDLDAQVYLTQNDGTLLTAEEAAQRPILTIGSGPTNSMRGAAYLSGLSEAIVVDVGGTSTDVGLLVDGFPRESAHAVDVGGVRTNYRMPDLISIGLGGGSVARLEPTPAAGPDSVGHDLQNRSLVFGGDVATLSDVAVLTGRMTMGDPELARVRLSTDAVTSLTTWVDDQIAVLTDRIKAARSELPVVAVGGGAALVPDAIPGTTAVLRHRHAAVANAIGAAIAEASGSLDRTFDYSIDGREASLANARDQAVGLATQAGADPSRVRITSVVETPLSYVPGECARVQVKAAGPLL